MGHTLLLLWWELTFLPFSQSSQGGNGHFLYPFFSTSLHDRVVCLKKVSVMVFCLLSKLPKDLRGRGFRRRGVRGRLFGELAVIPHSSHPICHQIQV